MNWCITKRSNATHTPWISDAGGVIVMDEDLRGGWMYPLLLVLVLVECIRKPLLKFRLEQTTPSQCAPIHQQIQRKHYTSKIKVVLFSFGFKFAFHIVKDSAA
jgi:hypothetical protein